MQGERERTLEIDTECFWCVFKAWSGVLAEGVVFCYTCVIPEIRAATDASILSSFE